MKKTNKYSYGQALNDIEKLVKRVVKHSEQLSEFKFIIDNARKRKTVPIRGIQEKLMNYREQYQEYDSFTAEERKMLNDVMDLWG